FAPSPSRKGLWWCRCAPPLKRTSPSWTMKSVTSSWLSWASKSRA
ncbi:ribosome-binding ATPase YchF, partial [Klebsiella pneumoniae]